ncbi:MAG: FadR family transcriptional regulator [Actinomycetaceae bacterium]|nr:FadR family transcriptional regulator [Actinomycetaceae bacterium]
MGRSRGAIAVDDLIGLIADGTFRAGDALPPEADLAAMIGVSRLTLREAVRVLKDRGVLRVVHGRGTYVVPMSEWTDLGTIMDVLGATTEPVELGMQLIEVRRMIEVGACGLAAKNRTDEDLDVMRRELQNFEDACKDGDVESVLAADIAFHRAIVAAANNPFLQTFMKALESPMLKSRRSTTAVREVRARAQEHHHAIFTAIAHGDVEEAKEAMRAHMTQTKKDLAAL